MKYVVHLTEEELKNIIDESTPTFKPNADGTLGERLRTIYSACFQAGTGI